MSKKKISKLNEEQTILAKELEKNSNLGQIIQAMLPYEIGTVKTIMQVSRLSQKVVRSGLTKLVKLHILYKWDSARIEIAREGRPEKPFLFTPYGADALQKSGYPEAQALSLDGPLDVAHRLCMALAGCHADFAPEIEKVYPYGDGKNARIDLVTRLEGTSLKRLVEIEQHLEGNHKDRAIAKLLGLRELFSEYSNAFDDEVLFIFNLIDEDLERTIKVWRSALKEVGWVPYTVQYCTLRDFLETPYFDAIAEFPILIPSETKSHRYLKEEENADQIEVPLDAIDDLLSSVKEISELHPRRTLREQEKERIKLFFTILNHIYDADFNQTGATKKFGLYPAISLARLRDFLHLEINRPLLARMRKTIADIRKRQLGLTLYQDAISKFVWNIFMRWFGFGRGGPITIFIIVPEVGGKNPEIRFDVYLNLPSELTIYISSDNQNALDWVLSAFLIYPEELGLIDPQ